MSDQDSNTNDTVENIMQILGEDDASDTGSAPLKKDNPAPQDEAGALEEGPPDGSEQKTDEQEQVEAATPIEPPASLRSDEKELFKTLPREAQEALVRIQQAADSHFTQRSTELAQARRAADDERQQYQSDRARYQAELGRVSQMAAQLLPAQFQDIQSHADYLRLKATDPARASQFEAFRETLQMAQHQQVELQKQQLQEHLAREYQALAEKIPDFKDGTKATALLNEVRKTAVEYYGFTPQEVEVIQDHRYVPIVQDAMKWRQYQANLKAVQTKKLAPAPTKVLPTTANNGQSNLRNDQRAALINRARNSASADEKADILASLL